MFRNVHVFGLHRQVELERTEELAKEKYQKVSARALQETYAGKGIQRVPFTVPFVHDDCCRNRVLDTELFGDAAS